MRIAVIPARGGSKRIPRKNLRQFHGHPIIAYSIRCALNSGLFDAGVYVSTEDEEISRIARSEGACVHRRPMELADDYVGTQIVMQEALRVLTPGANAGDYACCVYATSPMMTAQDLRTGFLAMTETDWHPSYAFSVSSYASPPQRSMQLDRDGSIMVDHPELIERRSQDLPVTYHDAGQWYWGRATSFLRNEPLYGPHAIGVPVPRMRAQDIDTEEDLMIAEAMYAALQGKP